jgi:hypothetical protein
MVLVNVIDATLKGIDVKGFSGPLLSISNVTGSGLDGAVPYRPTTAPTR